MRQVSEEWLQAARRLVDEAERVQLAAKDDGEHLPYLERAISLYYEADKELATQTNWRRGEEPKTYRIMRYFKDSNVVPQRVEGLSGLTLEQAREHCSRSDTANDAWFDGYVEEKGE